jgi:hypothetical protein
LDGDRLCSVTHEFSIERWRIASRVWQSRRHRTMKPRRPVTLRPQLSLGLPLQTLCRCHYAPGMTRFVKRLFDQYILIDRFEPLDARSSGAASHAGSDGVVGSS